MIHAAAGLFYGSIGGNLFTYPSNGEPFSGRPSFANVIHVSNPYATDPKDFCNGDPVCIAGGVGHSPYPFIYNPQKSRSTSSRRRPHHPRGPELPLAGELPVQPRL